MLKYKDTLFRQVFGSGETKHTPHTNELTSAANNALAILDKLHTHNLRLKTSTQALFFVARSYDNSIICYTLTCDTSNPKRFAPIFQTSNARLNMLKMSSDTLEDAADFARPEFYCDVFPKEHNVREQWECKTAILPCSVLLYPKKDGSVLAKTRRPATDNSEVDEEFRLLKVTVVFDDNLHAQHYTMCGIRNGAGVSYKVPLPKVMKHTIDYAVRRSKTM